MDTIETILLQRVDEVLYYIWDPIGVSDEPRARDEYGSYVLGVFSKVMAKVSPEEIARYLEGIQTNEMGLGITYENTLRTANILLEYREVIFDE